MAERGLTVRETVDARKNRYDADALAQVFRDVEKVLVAKGKKVLELDPDSDWDALVPQVLGRTGMLRAPAARVGRTMVVGYNDATWEAAFARAH